MPGTTLPMVGLRGVDEHVDELHVLRSIDLDLDLDVTAAAAEEVVVVIGPSVLMH